MAILLCENFGKYREFNPEYQEARSGNESEADDREND
jgi:hypothetical protein